MAAGDVEFKFFADTNAAEAAIVKLERRYDSLEAKVKQTARASKRGTDEGVAGFREMTATLSGVIGPLIGIQTAGQAVGAVFREIQADIEAATERADKFTQKLITELTAAGDLAFGKEIREALQTTPGATPEQATAAFFDVTGAAPRAPLNQRLAIAQAVAPLGGILDEGGQGITARLAARIGRVDQGAAPGDLADLALAIQQQAGVRAQQLDTPGFQRALGILTQRGVGLETAAAFTLQGVEAGIRPSSIASIAGKLDAEKGLTLQAILSDPDLARRALGQDNAAKVGQISLADVQAQAGFLRQAQAGDFVAQQLGLAENVDIDIGIRQRANVEKEAADRARGELQRGFDTEREAILAETPPGLRPIAGFGLSIRDFVATVSQTGFFGGEESTNALLQRQTEVLEDIRDRQQGRVNPEAQTE